jgi:hypothetical protein
MNSAATFANVQIVPVYAPMGNGRIAMEALPPVGANVNSPMMDAPSDAA